jgi:hypothetical protein
MSELHRRWERHFGDNIGRLPGHEHPTLLCKVALFGPELELRRGLGEWLHGELDVWSANHGGTLSTRSIQLRSGCDLFRWCYDLVRRGFDQFRRFCYRFRSGCDLVRNAAICSVGNALRLYLSTATSIAPRCRLQPGTVHTPSSYLDIPCLTSSLFTPSTARLVGPL